MIVSLVTAAVATPKILTAVKIAAAVGSVRRITARRDEVKRKKHEG